MFKDLENAFKQLISDIITEVIPAAQKAAGDITVTTSEITINPITFTVHSK